MKKIALALATTLTLAASAASAQVYVGGALGQSNYDTDCGPGVSCDRSPVGFKLFGGYKLNKFVAIEGAYTDFGDAKFSYTGYNGRLSGTSFGIGAAGFYDFHPQWTAVGRIGLSSNKLKYNDNLFGLTSSSSESNIKPYFGLGLGFRVAPNTTIEAGADFTRFELDGEGVSTRLLHLGVRQAF